MARFDHSNVSGNCVQCHNGVDAQGKPARHITSNDQCDDCHTTNAWVPAVFDHSAVAPGTCTSCHDGVTAIGKNRDHVPTMAQCDLCHSTLAWIPATFDHSTVTGSCSSCHDGRTATGTPAGHFQSAEECDYCHTADAWQPVLFVHTSPNYPGDHRRNLDCTDCHGSNSDTVSWPAPAYQPDCAGCHANDFRSGSHRKTQSPSMNYTVSELRDCSGACHVYADSSLTTISRARPGPQHRVSDGSFDR